MNNANILTPYELSIFISLLANAISEQIPNVNTLSLLGSMLNQLGDSITTIAIQRSIIDSSNTKTC